MTVETLSCKIPKISKSSLVRQNEGALAFHRTDIDIILDTYASGFYVKFLLHVLTFF